MGLRISGLLLACIILGLLAVSCQTHADRSFKARFLPEVR